MDTVTVTGEMSNRQVALLAAVENLTVNGHTNATTVLQQAERFIEWLETGRI